jgi:RNA polymerase sigma factor (TIGR02999 family)
MSAEAPPLPAAAGLAQLLLDPLVYAELCRMAARHLRRGPSCPTLEPSVLVHEVYLRLARASVPGLRPAEFFGLATRLMRQVLIDQHRRRAAAKRGGAGRTVPIEAAEPATAPEPDRMDLREALARLARHHPEHARLVRLRYFEGLTIAETARALARSPAAVKRDWCRARDWLRQELT